MRYLYSENVSNKYWQQNCPVPEHIQGQAKSTLFFFTDFVEQGREQVVNFRFKKNFFEFIDSSSNLCWKDLSKEVTTELTSRLLRDPNALDRFYRSFGLDSTKFSSRRGQWSITEFFPDTPIKMLKEVFGALHLYDLVELLERVTKPRTLHPALSLKEIENLQDASNRPTKFYNKAKVLIIHNDDGIVGNNAEKIGTFFKALNRQTQVTTLSMDPQKELLNELPSLRQESVQLILPEYLSHYTLVVSNPLAIPTVLNYPFGHEKQRVLVEERQQRTKEKEEELKKINEKFLLAFSTTIDKWVEHANDEGWFTSFI